MRELSGGLLDRWEANGRLVLRSVLDPARVAEIDDAVRAVEAWADGSGPGLHHFELTGDGPRIARSEDFQPHSEVLATFLTSGIIREILTGLFGQPPVLFKEKVNYKYPGGAGFAPHQDATAYRFVDHHISVMVPLDPATIESGCLWFCDRQPRIIDHDNGRISPRWVDDHRWVPIEVEPGDLVFFDSYAPHYSETNHTSAPRRALYLTYNRRSDGDQRDRYYADKRALLEASATSSVGRVRMSVNDDFLGRPVVS